MQWFLDLKIATELLAGFIFVALIAAVIGYEGVTGLKDVAESDKELYEQQTVPVVQMGKISTFFQRVRVNTRDILLAKTPEEIDGFAQKIKIYRDEMTKLSAEVEKTIDTPEERQLMDEFKQSRLDYARNLDVLMELGRNQNDVEGMKYLNGDYRSPPCENHRQCLSRTRRVRMSCSTSPNTIIRTTPNSKNINHGSVKQRSMI